MEEIKSSKIRVILLSALNYYSLSNHTEVALSGGGLWKYIAGSFVSSQSETSCGASSQSVQGVIGDGFNWTQKVESQKRNPALAYILALFDSTFELFVRKMRDPRQL